jgi:mRNA-degrading endonuclease YafQ of YafQ-DinJ toxin-antitoxin module
MRKVKNSERFLKEFSKFVKSHPDIEDLLRDFIALRKTADARTSPFNQKDYPFSGGNLKGIYHVHLRHGDVIVIYTYDADNLYLHRMVNHSAIDGMSRRGDAMAAAIDTTSMIDFPDDEPDEISPEQQTEVRKLIYELAAEKDPSMRAFVRGEPAPEFIQLLRIAADDADPQDIYDALGGMSGMVEMIKTVRSQMGIRETSMRAMMNIVESAFR